MREKVRHRDDTTQSLRNISSFLSSSDNWQLEFGKRHTGVLEGTPSSEAALWDAHGNQDAGRVAAMPSF
jgi:surface antigen